MTRYFLLFFLLTGCGEGNLDGLDNFAETSKLRTLEIISGDAQQAALGRDFPLPLTVRLSTPSGSAVGEAISFSVISGDLTLEKNTAATDATGTATTNVTAGLTSGVSRVSASTADGQKTVTFALEITADSQNKGFALTIESGNFQKIEVGATSEPLKVLATRDGIAIEKEEIVYSISGFARGELTDSSLLTSKEGFAQTTFKVTEAGESEITAHWKRVDKSVIFKVTASKPEVKDDTPIVVDVIPKDKPVFEGCLDALALDTSRIRVRVTWPTDATKMSVYRNGTPAWIGTDSTVNSFVDPALSEGVNYVYECKATIDNEVYVGTRTLTVQTKLENAPNFAGITSATASSVGSAVVVWKSASNSGAAASYYLIYATPGVSGVNFASTPVGEVDVGELTYTVTGLGDELTYSFGVRACNESDVCDSNAVFQTATMVNDGAPKTVGAVSVSLLNGSAIISAPWEHTRGRVAKRKIYSKTGGAATLDITDYALIRQESVSDPYNPSTALSVSGLSESRTYHFIVLDEDQGGATSTPTSTASITILDLQPPVFSGLDSLTLGSQRDSQIIATYTAVANETASVNGANTYLVYLTSASYGGTPTNPCSKTLADFTIDGSTFNGGDTKTYTLSGLSEKTVYRVCIKARDSSNNTSNSTLHATVTTEDVTPPQFDGAAAVSYASGIKINWSPSLSPDISNYKITLWKNAQAKAAGIVLFASHSSHQTEKIVSNSEYGTVSEDDVYIEVEACDNASSFGAAQNNCTNGATPSPLTITMPDTVSPVFAGITGVTSTLEGRVTASWTVPGDTSDIAGFMIYEVFNDEDLTLRRSVLCSPTCPSSGSVTGMGLNKLSYWHVKAFDAAGNLSVNDPVADKVSVTVLDSTAPTWVNGVGMSATFASGSPQTMTVSYNAATDGQVTGAITYKVYLSTSTFPAPSNPDVGLLVGSTTSSSFTTPVTDFTQYYVQICASDVQNNFFCSSTPTSFTSPDLSPPASVVLSNLPAPSNVESPVTSVNVTVGGSADLTRYKYKIVSGSTCVAGGYNPSAGRHKSLVLTESISAMADGPISICVIGGDASDNYTLEANAIRHTWTKDVIAPSAPTLAVSPSRGNISINFIVNSVSPENLMIVKKSSAISFVPVNGTTYTLGDTLSDGSVFFSSTQSIVDTAVVHGTTYHYHIYAYDNAKNYSTAYTFSYEAREARWAKIAIATSTGCGLTEGGDVYCWGSGQNIGNTAYTTSSNVTVMTKTSAPTTGATTYTDITGIAGGVCALGSDDYVYCWGGGGSGNWAWGGVAANPYRPARVSDTTFKSIKSRAGFFCGLTKADSYLMCWGVSVPAACNGGAATAALNTPAQCLGTMNVALRDYAIGSYATTCGIGLDYTLYCTSARADFKTRVGSAVTINSDLVVISGYDALQSITIATPSRICGVKLGETQTRCFGFDSTYYLGQAAASGNSYITGGQIGTYTASGEMITTSGIAGTGLNFDSYLLGSDGKLYRFGQRYGTSPATLAPTLVSGQDGLTVRSVTVVEGTNTTYGNTGNEAVCITTTDGKAYCEGAGNPNYRLGIFTTTGAIPTLTLLSMPPAS